VERIYAAIQQFSRDPGRDRALFSVLLHGLRAEKAINLNFEDYDAQRVMVREANHPGGEVLLTQSARADLDAYLQQRQTTATRQESPQSPLFISNSKRYTNRRNKLAASQEFVKAAEGSNSP
jgi:integrase/recombinase XerD